MQKSTHNSRAPISGVRPLATLTHSGYVLCSFLLRILFDGQVRGRTCQMTHIRFTSKPTGKKPKGRNACAIFHRILLHRSTLATHVAGWGFGWFEIPTAAAAAAAASHSLSALHLHNALLALPRWPAADREVEKACVHIAYPISMRFNHGSQQLFAALGQSVSSTV